MQNQKINFIDFEKIKELKKQQISRESSSIDRSLGSVIMGLESIGEDMEKNHIPRISENAFVKYFLKAFAGFGTQEDINATYLTWVSDVAKSYGIPVNVCDDNDSSVILFTVPAVGNNSAINPEKTNSKEVYRAISLANDARFLQPYNWEKILSNNLDHVLLKLYDKSKVAVSEDYKKWQVIFERYKDIILAEAKNNGVQREQVQQNSTATKAQDTYDEIDEPI